LFTAASGPASATGGRFGPHVPIGLQWPMQHWSSEAQTSSSWRQLAVAQIRLTQTPSAQSLVVAHFPPFALGRHSRER